LFDIRFESIENQGMPDDDLLAALVRAIAWELIELGYRPSPTPGYIQHAGEEPDRLVAEETWRAMNEIMAGGEPDAPRDGAQPLPAKKPLA
jgi:hypothetical protein